MACLCFCSCPILHLCLNYPLPDKHFASREHALVVACMGVWLENWMGKCLDDWVVARWQDGWVDWLWNLPNMTRCSFWPCCNIMGYTFITYDLQLGIWCFGFFVFRLGVRESNTNPIAPHIPIICACSLCAMLQVSRVLKLVFSLCS